MRVLSLFDGTATGLYVLKKLNIPIEKYYASEIDKYAIAIAMKNHPEIEQLGDVQGWHWWDIDWSQIDLVIGGSPCQGFSFAGKQLAFYDPRSKLFFEFVAILKYAKSKNHKVKFMLENVKMKKEYQDIISDYMGVQPIKIDAGLVSAQRRVRLYWTNIPNVEQPEDRGIMLKDILQSESEIDDRYYASQKQIEYIERRRETFGSQSSLDADKAITMVARQYSSWNGNYITSEKGIRECTVIECERLNGLTDNYTKAKMGNGVAVSIFQRRKALGNGWQADVIEHIFKGLL